MAGLVAFVIGVPVAVGGGLTVAFGATTTIVTTTVPGPTAEQYGLLRMLSAPTVQPPAPRTGETALPARVMIPAVDISSTLVGLGIAGDGSLETPADYQQAGWFDRGVKPGDVGPAVIVGHIDSKVGPGVFYRLRTLQAGAIVGVQRADGTTVSFAVDTVREYSKTAFPTELVYGATDTATLRLVTCGGAFDREKGSYVDNVVVYAHEVTVSTPGDQGDAPSLVRALSADR